MTIGGVATSNGDFRCTRIVDRCLVAGEELGALGEKAAIVGGFGSSLPFPDPLSDTRAGEDAISVSQGVSVVDIGQYKFRKGNTFRKC